MGISIPLEPSSQQTVVATTPETVGKLVKLGHEVVMQADADMTAKFTDASCRSAGATIVNESVRHNDIVMTLDTPPERFCTLFNGSAMLISRLAPDRNEELVKEFA